MDPSVSWPVVALLSAASFVAGAIDAIAGGGGLITLPVLLAAGLPPQLALGTNKGQSVFGSFAALVRYWRAGLVDRRRAGPAFAAAFAGSLGGASLLLLIDPSFLRPLVLVLLVGAGLVVAIRPLSNAAERPPPKHAIAIAAALALVIGAYDGFFGPGTGTFLIIAFVGLLHVSLPRATADAKVANFASNLAAVILFASKGAVLWEVALPMAGAQLLGGFTGAHLAVKGGDKVIRKVVLGVVVALVVKLAVELVRG